MGLLLLKDEERSRETLQETWLRAMEKIDSFEGRSSFKTWLTGIFINCCKERFRESGNISELTQNMKVETVERTINSMDLKKAITSLPDGYRAVLVLHDVEGYKHKEIARMLGIHEGTSKSQLYYARKSVRKFLNDLYYDKTRISG